MPEVPQQAVLCRKEPGGRVSARQTARIRIDGGGTLPAISVSSNTQVAGMGVANATVRRRTVP